jgi:hypothetical protein
MPKARPRQVAETGFWDERTYWFVVAHNDDTTRQVVLRLWRPGGRHHKATLVDEITIEPNTLAVAITGPRGEPYPVEPNHQIYATIFPPLKSAGARMERFDRRLLEAPAAAVAERSETRAAAAVR